MGHINSFDMSTNCERTFRKTVGISSLHTPRTILNSSVLWVITRFEAEVSGLPTGPIFKGQASSSTALSLKFGLICSPETSVSNHLMPRINPVHGSLRLHTYNSVSVCKFISLYYSNIKCRFIRGTHENFSSSNELFLLIFNSATDAAGSGCSQKSSIVPKSPNDTASTAVTTNTDCRH
jgi:hypothetical protein